jgi:uncharacterized protein YecT (DUF1311 family)
MVAKPAMKASMKSLLLVLLAIIALCLAPLLFGQSQAKMNQDAAGELKKANEEMLSLCQKIVEKYSKGPEANTVFVQKFEKAQSAWLSYSDAHLDAIFPSATPSEYGSVYPMCLATLKTELTKTRIAQLRQWSEGIEEGEVCLGSRPIKK